MRKRAPIQLFLACCFALCALLYAFPLKVAANSMPVAVDNLNIGLRSTSELVAEKDGYMRVFYDGKKIGIEYYNDSFVLQSKRSLDMELSIWGGFYAGLDAYYVVEGQANKEESDTNEVIRVIRYDKGWNKTGTAKITGNPELFGGEVRYPFDYGCVEMAEHGGTLYIVTGHEGYVDSQYNQGHQGFLMVAVDETSMSGRIVDCDLWHSFAQYITNKDGKLYVLEQSEGSRYTKLSRYDAGNLAKDSLPVLKYGGSRDSAWAISCFASVDGMAVSDGHVLCLGTSIDQSKYDSVSSDTAHNIYLTVTPTEDFSENATTVKWLTGYSGSGKCFLGAKITRVNNDRFLVSWEEYGTSQAASTDDVLSESVLHYLFVDGEGNVASKEFTAAAPISDCQPIVKGSSIVYYASNANMVNFYSINAETGAFSKRVHRVAGEEATWDLKKGVLTISGAGDMAVDTEENSRHPISSVSGAFVHSSSDNVWKPIREYTEQIVIAEGITSVPENAFAYFDKLTEVEIEPGLQSIGKQAFYSCEALKKITIPASVSRIGEDILWTGSYWVSSNKHVVRATVYAPENSYAIQYAKENDISYVEMKATDEGKENSSGKNKISIKKAKISGIKSSYVYTGKARKPKVTVRLNGKTLKKDKEYQVSYSRNVETGKATVKIKGIGSYRDTVTKTFKIVPKKAALSKLASPKAKTIRVSWKKDPQASGYQIQYAQNAKFSGRKGMVNIPKKSTTAKTISKLKRGKKYYVRIRVYKKISGKKCYGAWSKTKTVKCK